MENQSEGTEIDEIEQLRSKLLMIHAGNIQPHLEQISKADLFGDVQSEASIRKAAIRLSELTVRDILTPENLYAQEIEEVAANCLGLLKEVYSAVLIFNSIEPESAEDQLIRTVIDYRSCFKSHTDPDSREVAFLNQSISAPKIDFTGNSEHVWQIDINLALGSVAQFTKEGEKIELVNKLSEPVKNSIASTAFTCGYERMLAAIYKVGLLYLYARSQDVCPERNQGWLRKQIDYIHMRNAPGLLDCKSILNMDLVSVIDRKMKQVRAMH